MNQSKTTRRRMKLAAEIERALVIEPAVVCCASPYLVHPAVTTACTAPLEAIMEALRDETTPLAAPVLCDVRSFILDGTSPLFDRDADAARIRAAALRHAVLDVHASASRRGTARRRWRLTSASWAGWRPRWLAPTPALGVPQA